MTSREIRSPTPGTEPYRSRLALQRASQEAPHEESPKKKIDGDSRERGNQRPGHLYVPLDEVAASQVGHRHGDWRKAWVTEHDDAKEIIVPDRSELPE